VGEGRAEQAGGSARKLCGEAHLAPRFRRLRPGLRRGGAVAVPVHERRLHGQQHGVPALDAQRRRPQLAGLVAGLDGAPARVDAGGAQPPLRPLLARARRLRAEVLAPGERGARHRDVGERPRRHLQALRRAGGRENSADRRPGQGAAFAGYCGGREPVGDGSSEHLPAHGGVRGAREVASGDGEDAWAGLV